MIHYFYDSSILLHSKLSKWGEKVNCKTEVCYLFKKNTANQRKTGTLKPFLGLRYEKGLDTWSHENWRKLKRLIFVNFHVRFNFLQFSWPGTWKLKCLIFVNFLHLKTNIICWTDDWDFFTKKRNFHQLILILGPKNALILPQKVQFWEITG